MELSPSSEANRSSVSQETSYNLMETEGSLSHSQQSATCPYPEPDQSSPCPISWRSISILSSYPQPVSSEWSPSLGSPHQNFVCTYPVPHAYYMPRPFHSSWFDHPNNLVRSTDHTVSPLCSLLHSPCTSSLLGPNIRLSTLLSNALSLLFSVSVCIKLDKADCIWFSHWTVGTWKTTNIHFQLH